MRRLDYRWIILGTGFSILFFSGGSRFAFGLMLKPMTEDLGWSRSSLSLAVTSFMIVSALSTPIIGQLVDRYSIRWVLAGGVIVAAVGLGLIGRVTAPWQVFPLYGILFAIGNTASSISPVGVMINRWFTKYRGIATSAAISGNGVGQLVLITVLAAVLTALSWRTSFVILAAANVAIILPLILLFIKSRPPTGDEQSPPDSIGEPQGEEVTESDEPAQVPEAPTMSMSSILASRQLWFLVVIYTICGFQDFFVSTHVVAFATDLGMGSVLAGNLLALMGLMGLFGVMSGGMLSDAYGAVRPTAICFLIRIVLFSFILTYKEIPGIAGFALMYGFTFFITAPLSVIFARSIFGAPRMGVVSGIIGGIHSIGGGLGAYVGGVFFDWKGNYDAAFILMLCLSFVAISASFLVRERPAYE